MGYCKGFIFTTVLYFIYTTIVTFIVIYVSLYKENYLAFFKSWRLLKNVANKCTFVGKAVENLTSAFHCGTIFLRRIF